MLGSITWLDPLPESALDYKVLPVIPLPSSLSSQNESCPHRHLAVKIKFAAGVTMQDTPPQDKSTRDGSKSATALQIDSTFGSTSSNKRKPDQMASDPPPARRLV